jgi:hypothetical protein
MEPYIIKISDKSVCIFRARCKKTMDRYDCHDNHKYYNRFVRCYKDCDVDTVYIPETHCYGKKVEGANALIQLKDGTYTFVGEEVYNFTPVDNENLKAFYAPMGPDGDVFSVAIGQNHIYFLSDKMYASLCDCQGFTFDYREANNYDGYCDLFEQVKSLKKLKHCSMHKW